jgi:hypothetical protein
MCIYTCVYVCARVCGVDLCLVHFRTHMHACMHAQASRMSHLRTNRDESLDKLIDVVLFTLAIRWHPSISI